MAQPKQADTFPEFGALTMPDEVRKQFEIIQHYQNEIAKACAAILGMLPQATDKPNTTTNAIKRFDANHRVKFKGQGAHFTQPKDNALMKRIVEERGVDVADELIDEFFRIDDDWLVQQGYTVGVFSRCVPRLIARMNGQPRVVGVTRNTQQNRDHVRTASELIRSQFNGTPVRSGHD